MATKKITLNELRSLIKQIIKEETNNFVSVFDYVDNWENDGYAVALYDKNKNLINKYVDPSDYPDMYLINGNNNATIVSGEFKGGHLMLHSGHAI